MNKQLLLFETRYTESFDAIQVKLERIIPFLWQSIDVPFQDWAYRRETDERFKILDRGQAAQWLRPQVVHEVRRIFSEIDGAICRSRKGMFFLDYDDIHIHFKKLGKGFKHSNYPTWHNSEYWNQELPLSHAPRVIFGYRPFANLTMYRTFLTMPLFNRPPLCAEIPDQTDQLIQIAPQPESHVDQGIPGYRVSPKDSEKEEGG